MIVLPHKYCPITFHPAVLFSDNVGVKHLHFDHSPVVHITNFIKNNNKNNNKNTPAFSSGLGWAPHLHILIFAPSPSVYCTTICTNNCTIECHFSNRVPAQKFSAHRSSDPKTQCPR